MFWNRKVETKAGSLGHVIITPAPARKEFVTMLELLKSAEMFDNKAEFKVSDGILKILKDKIDSYLSAGQPSKN